MMNALVVVLFLGFFALVIFCVMAIDLFAHELGHGLAAILLGPRTVVLYMGSYHYRPDSWRIRIGRMLFCVRRNPFYWTHGLCKHWVRDEVWKQLVITAAGPFMTLILLLIAIVFFILNIEGGIIGPVSAVAAMTLLISFLVNMLPGIKSIVTREGKVLTRDGPMIAWLLRWYRSQQRYMRVHKLTLAGRTAAARALLQELEQTAGDSEAYYTLIANLQLQLEDYHAAARRLAALPEKGVTLSPAGLGLLAHAYVLCKDYPAAMQIYGQLLQATPDDEAVLQNAGYCMTAAGRYADAIEVLSRAIALNPERASGFGNRSYARFQCGELEAGLADLETALRLEPDPAHGYDHRNRGCYLLRSGRPAEALPHLLKAKAADPGIPGLEALIAEASEKRPLTPIET